MKMIIGLAAMLATIFLVAGVLAQSLPSNVDAIECDTDHPCATQYHCVDGACVLNTCGLEFTDINQNPITGINFGTNVLVGSTVNGNPSPLNVKNTGNSVASLSISGTDWNFAPTSIGTVGATEWSADGSTFAALETTSVQITSDLGSENSQPVYFKLTVPLGTTKGTYTQTITFTAGC